jgi:hypothetical protein
MKTAVEYLVKEFSDILGPLDMKPMQDLLLVDAIKKAKEMEQEQREADFIAGYEKRAELSNLLFDKISEQSAKELFKQQKRC